MHSAIRLLLSVALTTSLLPGCALLKKFHRKRPPVVKESPQMQSVGKIVLVSHEGLFVLIDSGTQPNLTKGSTVQTRSADGSTAQLRVTDIRKRPFVVADIVSGTPQKGDEVFQ